MTPSHDGSLATLVVNATAGRGRAARLLPLVTGALVAGLTAERLQVIQSDSWADARSKCVEVVAKARPATPTRRADSLLVMGGDGMMHLGLNAAADTAVPLGLIPAGRGNDFCRGVGLPTTAAGAVRTIVEGHTRRIDLMKVTGGLLDGAEQAWVGSIVSTGFDARVNYRSNRLRFSFGMIGYAIATLAELSRFEPLSYRMVIDGVPREQTAMFVAVGNAGWFGGGMHVCPDAQIDDGLLDITVVHPVSRATLLRLLPAMYSGRFVKDPAAELLQAKEVVIDGDGLFAMADGEELGAVPVSLRAVRDALTIYAPRAK